ncbi:MAG TPA: hypothetical protein VFZ98_06150 [Vicinamibacterales bacterium]
MTKRILCTLSAILLAVAAVDITHGSSPQCDVSGYHSSPGLTAAMEQDVLAVTWNGRDGEELRARYAVNAGQPVLRDVSIRKAGGAWHVLARDLTPEYRATSGVRRMSEQQAQPLRDAGVELTQAVIDRNRWYAFWDAPLLMPDAPELRRSGRSTAAAPRVLGPPRTPAEIRRAEASFSAASCAVATDGAALTVTFQGVSMGIFSGSLRFTSYRGANLMRMDAVARTNEPWVSYKYEAGLKGFSTDLTPRVVWHDTGGHPQRYEFGGPANTSIVPIKAANRLLTAEGQAGSLTVFPPPHTFFFTREVDTNLGYVWYRKDATGSFALGIRQPDREENPQYVENFALYNAPPGTWQRMGMYLLASLDSGDPARTAALAYTRGDAFKPLAGYKTMVNHFHLRFTERLRASGSLDTPLPDLAAMRALGLNIIGLSDFHGDMHPNDPGPVRFTDQKDYAEASRRASDKDFLVTPWEEPSAYFGGHYNILFPKNVYWSKVRRPGQPFEESDPAYGKVYHAGSTEDVQKMMDAEGAYWYHAHPRTKGTTGYPDLIFDMAWTKNDRYLGVAFKPGMGMDLSESRLCEWRCFDSVDTMNNLYAGTGVMPKYVIADIDTYQKGPEDDLYPNFPVNYLRLDTVPGPDGDWSPILRALRRGEFFVTTGEILIPRYSVEGTGSRRTIVADVEWTFPLAFVEVVWGDGKTIDRQIVSATELPAFGTKRFSIPFDASGKAWVRFAVWDSAGNGAFVQPTWMSR